MIFDMKNCWNLFIYFSGWCLKLYSRIFHLYDAFQPYSEWKPGSPRENPTTAVCWWPSYVRLGSAETAELLKYGFCLSDITEYSALCPFLTKQLFFQYSIINMPFALEDALRVFSAEISFFCTHMDIYINAYIKEKNNYRKKWHHKKITLILI